MTLEQLASRLELHATSAIADGNPIRRNDCLAAAAACRELADIWGISSVPENQQEGDTWIDSHFDVKLRRDTEAALAKCDVSSDATPKFNLDKAEAWRRSGCREVKGRVVIRFDGPPGPEMPRIIEVERDGKSIKFGEWVQDGEHWLLVLPEGV